jgi:hypothetical protein
VVKRLLLLLLLLLKLLLPHRLLLLLLKLLPHRLLQSKLLHACNKKADASRLFYCLCIPASTDLAPRQPFVLRCHGDPVVFAAQHSTQRPHRQLGKIVLATQMCRDDMLQM